MTLMILVYCIALLFGLGVFGHFVLSVLRIPIDKDGFYELFVRLAVGCLVVISIYAIAMTSGRTVIWGLVLLSAIWLFVRHRFAQTYPAKDLNTYSIQIMIFPVLVIMGILVVFTVFNCNLYFHTPINNILHFDDVYYAWLSSKIELFGIESDEPLFAGPEIFPAIPYHYADLWLTSLVARLFNVSKIIAFSLIAKSCFQALSVFAFLTLAKTFRINWVMLIFSLTALALAPVLLDYGVIRENAFFLGGLKTSMASLFFIWPLYLLRKQSPIWFLPLLVLPVINIAYAPIVLTSLVILGFYMYLRLKDTKQLVFFMVPTITVGAFIFAFYYLQPKLVRDPFSLHDDILIYFNLKYLTEMSYRFAANSAMYVPYIIPALLFIVWKVLSKNSQHLTRLMLTYEPIIAYTVISFCNGWAMAFLFYPMAGENASQMNVITTMMLVGLVIIIALLVVYEELNSRLPKLLLTVFMGLIFSYSLVIFVKSRQNFVINPSSKRSAEFVADVTRYFEKNRTSTLGGMYQCPHEYYRNGKLGSRSELMNGYWFTPFVSTIDFLYVTSLNTLTTTYEDFDHHTLNFSSETDRNYYWWEKKTEKATRRAPFTYFHSTYFKSHPQADLNEVQLAFIREYGLGYVISSNECPLPEMFHHLIDKTFTDGLSGEKFHFLKQSMDLKNRKKTE